MSIPIVYFVNRETQYVHTSTDAMEEELVYYNMGKLGTTTLAVFNDEETAKKYCNEEREKEPDTIFVAFFVVKFEQGNQIIVAPEEAKGCTVRCDKCSKLMYEQVERERMISCMQCGQNICSFCTVYVPEIESEVCGYCEVIYFSQVCYSQRSDMTQ
jgi:hypothetical protein